MHLSTSPTPKTREAAKWLLEILRDSRPQQVPALIAQAGLAGFLGSPLVGDNWEHADRIHAIRDAVQDLTGDDSGWLISANKVTGRPDRFYWRAVRTRY
jgi:hypothetical protein